jgi:SNF2 family DNA or RNA helicase
MNWQHCARVIFVGASHSYEQTYQAIRRCWRFGQSQSVKVDIIHTEGERRIIENLSQKNDKAAEMFTNLVREMNNSINIQSKVTTPTKARIPEWMR